MDKIRGQRIAALPRRKFLALGLGAGASLATDCSLKRKEPVLILKAESYRDDLRQILLNGFKELGIPRDQIAGKRVLLKPNLIEPQRNCEHINTSPLLLEAAVAAFLHLGAASVVIGEGGGHTVDSYLVVEEAGLSDVLREHRIKFIDLNFSSLAVVPNQGRHTGMKHLVLPRDLFDVDILVSMPKMKTHHWAGATLSMKNLFGIMPGAFYGWPKNVLHLHGIPNSIVDINTTVRAKLAIVDGIVGMEGDGPIMGTPVNAKVIVMGTNLPAVDATCAGIMDLRPEKIEYLKLAENDLGPISLSGIVQRGEKIETVRRPFELLDFIPAHRVLRNG
ncbi:MAG: DUF362 domain-containing protein [Chitinispirillaceae bacterium]|nr:DUF362 domain-containing protein [Chitinispirillaceae bacterium]